MKVLHSWLEEILQEKLDEGKTSDVLNRMGLEVEKTEKISSVPGGLDGLVVGKVLECEPHPQADRLKVTKVDIGNGEVLPIVCGAPNVASGQYVIVALPGTTSCLARNNYLSFSGRKNKNQKSKNSWSGKLRNDLCGR